jgi:uncharacterized membrane protein
MDEVTIARALHVLSVVLWIGGVAFVTTVLLPAIRRLRSPKDRLTLFDAIERRFAWQARVTTALAGLTGLDMLVRLDLWHRFLSASYWWMHAMVVVWLLFMVMLFVAEPLILHRWLLARAKTEPEATFRRVERLHRLLLMLSLITLVGAVAGSHGFLLSNDGGLAIKSTSAGCDGGFRGGLDVLCPRRHVASVRWFRPIISPPRTEPFAGAISPIETGHFKAWCLPCTALPNRNLLEAGCRRREV